MVNFFRQGIAARQDRVQIFGEGLNEIDFQGKPAIADAPGERPGFGQQLRVFRRQAVDDAFQGITHVTRGRDLYAATHLHRLLQTLLGYNVPDYRHHPLMRDESGRRFAKRDKSVTLQELRAGGATPDHVRDMVKQILIMNSGNY